MIITLWRMRGDRNLTVYTVHEELKPVADRLDRAERLAFLRDGFSFPAALWAPAWLAARRLWLPLALYAAVAGGLGYGLHLAGFGVSEITVLVVAVHTFVGFEAYQLERWAYERRGFTHAGTVAGRNKIECERRFFDTWLPRQPVIAAPAKAASGQPAPGTLPAAAGDMAPRAAPDRRRPDDAAPSKPKQPWRSFRRTSA